MDYLENQPRFDIEFYNQHDMIYEDNLAMTCKKMELTDEFILKDKKYLSDEKYDIVECSYINRKNGNGYELY